MAILQAGVHEIPVHAQRSERLATPTGPDSPTGRTTGQPATRWEPGRSITHWSLIIDPPGRPATQTAPA